MKYFFLSLTLFLTLMSENAKAQYFGNYGACNGRRGRGYCRKIEDCDSFQSAQAWNPGLRSEGCSAAAAAANLNLVCCVETEVRNINAADQEDNLFPRVPQCGRQLGNRIYGGLNTAIDEFPWLVLLEYTIGSKEKEHGCSGTLINNRWVLTAAHCVVKEHIGNARLTGVRLGEWDTTTNPDCETAANGLKNCVSPHIEMPIDKIISHPRYNTGPIFNNDIALLRLSRPVANSLTVKPICLPLEQRVRDNRLVNQTAEVAGWGRTEPYDEISDVKRKAKLTVWSLSDCQQTFRRYRIGLQDTQLCAGGENGVDTCRGDSGGPLMLETTDDNQRDYYYIAGIVSFGKRSCGTQGIPGVYTRVGDFIDWIKETIRSNN